MLRGVGQPFSATPTRPLTRYFAVGRCAVPPVDRLGRRRRRRRHLCCLTASRFCCAATWSSLGASRKASALLATPSDPRQ